MRSLELLHGETKIPLKPQPAAFLRTLIIAAPDFVSRDALISELWPDGRIVEFDQGLNSCARQVRKALGLANGGDGDPHEFIETLARRGYRFVGQLEEDGGTSSRSGSLVAVLIILLLGVSITAIVPQLRSGELSAIPRHERTTGCFAERAAWPCFRGCCGLCRMHGTNMRDCSLYRLIMQRREVAEP